MKKILLFCLLIGGLSSISAIASIPLVNLEPEINLEYSNTENSSLLSLNYGVFDIDVLDIKVVSCTAHVYKDGVWQASFTRANCGDAWHAACLYITRQGGTCPIGL